MSRRPRSRGRRPGGASGRSSSGWFFAGGLAVVLVIGVIAVVLSRDDSDEDDGAIAESEVASSVSLDGQALPVRAGEDDDLAVGQIAPVARGEDFDGAPVIVGDGANPQLVVFLAHWCPHCQAEVPRLVAFGETEGFPEGLEVMAVATGTSSERDNYPPSAWLEGERWPWPVLVDTANGSVANAYGLSSYPYFVLLDAEGEVLARDSGELTESQLRDLVDLAVSSSDDEPDEDAQEPTPVGPPVS